MMKRGAPAPSIVDLNLLPREQRPPEVSPLALGLVALLFLSIAVLVPLALRGHEARGRAGTIEQQVNDAERSLHGLQFDLTKQRGLKAQLDAAQARLTALRNVRSHLRGGERPLDEDLAQLWGAGYLPPGARITAVTGTPEGFRVDGVAQGPLDAIAYADKLVNSAGFDDARLASFAPGGIDGGQFTLEVMR